MATRNNAISLRLSDNEREKLKVAATRLEVPESDVLRYAIDTSLRSLGPLLDQDSHGTELLPVFVESGEELLRFFHLDARQLIQIINGDSEDAEPKVDVRDLVLLTRLCEGQPAATVHLRALLGDQVGRQSDRHELKRRFREYLYDKYLYRSDSAAIAGG